MKYEIKEYQGLIDESMYDSFEFQNGNDMYIHAIYSCRMEDIIAYGTILFPTFVKIKEYIFIKSFLNQDQLSDISWLKQLEKDCNYCKKEIEMSVNSWSIGAFFAGSGDAKAMDNEKMIYEFGKLLEFSWKSRAKEIFPDKDFAVEIGHELMGELGISIAFYQKDECIL